MNEIHNWKPELIPEYERVVLPCGRDDHERATVKSEAGIWVCLLLGLE